MLVSALLLASCGGGDSTDSATTTAAATTAAPATTAAATTTTVATTTTAAPTTTTAVTIPVPKPAASDVAGLLKLGRPVVLAHAGGENAHPHSTAYAYADSVAAGVDLIDLDVQLTKDGVLIVHHDDTVDRTTNTTGKVADLTYAEIAKLDNSHWFTMSCTCKDQPDADYIFRGVRTGARPAPAGYTPDDFGIATFEQIAKRFPDHVLNIEIKGKAPEAIPAATELARLIKALGRENSTIVTAFDDPLNEAFHEMLPSVNITPGLGETSEFVLSNKVPKPGRTILQVPPVYNGITVLTPNLVERANAAGLVLWIWPNERKWENLAGYTELLQMGVHGLNAADPAQALAAVKAFKK